MNNGLQALGAYHEDIDAGLRQFFSDIPALLESEVSATGTRALEQLAAYCLRPSKRIRGSLAALTYDAAAKGSHLAAGITLGVVLELLQAYLLIVDDVTDRSALRRGEPAMHEVYRAEYADAHTADMIAVNIGLLAQHLAGRLLAGIDVPAPALVQTTTLMQRNIALTGFGQLDDIAHGLDVALDEADIIRKYVQKSSYYTFVNPLQLGFALAGQADASTLQACEAFGTAAGVAFQLHDDYLGMFGTAEALGKSNLDDLREGKYTLLVQYALTHAPAPAITTLRALLGTPDASADDLAKVRDILQQCGAVEYCQHQAAQQAAIAKAVLRDQPFGTPELRPILTDIVDYAITREK